MNFQEALDLLKNNPKALLENNEEFWSLLMQIDNAATDILLSKDPDYVLGMSALVSALAGTVMISKGESLLTVMDLMRNEKVTDFAVLIMKFTLGLAVMEELR